MTRYAADLPTPVAFEEQHVANTLAEVLSAHGLRQLHVAETEKYAHVTYFFNGGREEPWPGEERVLVPSPRDVPSYDHKPEMSARRGRRPRRRAHRRRRTRSASSTSRTRTWSATPGSIPAVVTAGETADRCLGRVVERVAELGGVCLVTADHGNAETDVRSRTASARTRRTRRTRCRSSSRAAQRVSATAARSPIWLRRSSAARRARTAEMIGTQFVEQTFTKAQRKTHARPQELRRKGGYTPAPCRSHSPIRLCCGRPSEATNGLFA